VGRRLVVWGGIGLPIVILLGFLVVSVNTDRRSLAAQFGDSEDVLTIEITGRQFWWDVRYRADSPHLEIRTANEIHIPVGRPVRLELRSADVIHSFWVPTLQGKMDLIPGRVNTLFIQADEPGVMLGHCAEFCGDAHAHMRMIVVAQHPAEFEEWQESQLRRRERPTDPALAEGFDVFMAKACAFCHAISGTMAGGRTGPDLTHFGARRTIGAAILPNTRGHLMGWLADPQTLKPGNHMPSVPVEGQDLQRLADYLLSLH
jgi:cytochrome c oxidase subunit II